MIPVLLIALAAFLTQAAGWLVPLDRGIQDLRMASSPRDVTGSTVFVAIDSRSLDEIGVWPWPRSVHAQLLDRLVEAGASDIFLDIDFEFASDPADDAALAAALDRAGGATLLPVFVQSRAAGTDAETTDVNRPLPMFADLSWPAMVNVVPDADGAIRRYPFGADIDGEYISSAAALLARDYGTDTAEFNINLALGPESIPSYSAADIIAGRIPARLIAGRSVVVGAHALELRDSLVVPVHGVVPGALIHILAAETLKQGIAPRPAPPWLVFVLLLGALVQAQRLSRTDDRPWGLVTALALTPVLFEAAGLALFSLGSIVLPTGMIYPAILVFGLGRLAASLSVSSWVIRDKQAQIDNSRQLLRQVINDSSDAIVVLDADGHILQQSENAAVLTGASPDAALPAEMLAAAGDAIRDLRAGRWQRPPLAELRLGQGETERIFQYAVTPSKLTLLERSSRRRRDDDSYVATLSAREITRIRQQARQIDHLARYDHRTGALRRKAFQEMLDAQIASGSGATVFALNLHRFKTINVTLGRKVGDEVLKCLVDRLAGSHLGLSPAVRLDGDGFGVFTPRSLSEEEADDLAGALSGLAGQTYHLDGTAAQVGTRIGYAIGTPGPGLSGSLLLSQAEEALDSTKQAGGARIRRYDPSSARAQARAKSIEQMMWTALDREEFHLVYQPQLRLPDRTLTGVEALLRWDSAALGSIAPDEFIAVAESNGFITDLGRWVLHRACRDARRLPEELSLAVNVSAQQIWNGSIRADTESALYKSGVAPSRLELELTESIFVSPSDGVAEAMDRLRMFGVRWALDDFGAGYSSLGYLSQLPLDKIKLDRQFAGTIDSDPTARAIVRSMAQLCEGISVRLLCEGIETERQAQLVEEAGCREAQGYLFARPMPLDDLLRTFSLRPGRDRPAHLKSVT